MAKTKKTAAQLDHEIKEALRWGSRGTRGRGTRGKTHHVSRAADGRTPLYGHTSEATAYVVDDYPYGFTARTKIRYWLEHKAKLGWRFVSQTMNPKTSKWNKPKPSTYAEFGAAMFLDDKGHVGWEGIGQYTDDQKMLAFAQAFPGADKSVIRQLVPAKLSFLRDMISGKRFFTINGVRQEPDIERMKKELETWEEVSVWLDQAA